MPFCCCGIKYSKKDPLTYWCIESYLIKPPRTSSINGHKVIKELIDVICCKKCGNIAVNVYLYGVIKGRKRIIKKEEYTKLKAAEFLKSTEKNRVKLPQVFPFKKIPYSKERWYYYKNTSPYSQRRRYLNESSWVDNKITTGEIKNF